MRQARCTVDDIHARLATIPEPCSLAMGSPTNLRDMGLIDSVTHGADGAVVVILCLTDASCVHFRSMQQYIRDEVSALPGVTSVTIGQTLDKLWTPDRIRHKPV